MNKKFYFYFPFCFFIILLNGRTGLVTLSIGVIILILAKSISSFKGLLQALIVVVTGVACAAGGLYLLSTIQPTTFNWIASGFQDTLALIFEGDTSGNYEQLAGTFLTFPIGISHWLFGYGLRVYAGNASSMGFSASDIGYINDLFMGGLVYAVILYGTISSFAVAAFKQSSRQLRKSGLSLALFIVFLIANYKGETARSGLVLSGMILLEYILTISDKEMSGWK